MDEVQIRYPFSNVLNPEQWSDTNSSWDVVLKQERLEERFSSRATLAEARRVPHPFHLVLRIPSALERQAEQFAFEEYIDSWMREDDIASKYYNISCWSA